MSEAQATDTPQQVWRSQAAEIRDLLAAGLTPPQIRAHFETTGRKAPKPEAIYRARTYELVSAEDSQTRLSHPSYYMLWRFFLDEYDKAFRAGKVLVITREMKDLIDTAEACVLKDITGEPFTARRAKRKRKSQAKKKPK
jgi:hypothetical protein